MKKITESNLKKFLFSTIVLFFTLPAYAADTMSLWPSDPLTKVMQTAKAPKDAPKKLKIFAAKGETVSAQAVFGSSQDLNDVTAKISDLKHQANSSTISADNINLQWVRYIDVNRNSAHIPTDELIAIAPNSIADAYWEDITIFVKANRAQPLWLEIDVPQNTPAGDYTGNLIITAGTNESIELVVYLHVWDFELPKHRPLSSINWASFPGRPFAKSFKKFSDKYWDFLKRFCRFLVRHRQTGIQDSIWRLIEEKGDKQSGFSYDTSRLERYAQIAFDAGIQKIHLHYIGYRTADRPDPKSRMIPAEGAFRRLPILQKLIERKGWKGRILVNVCDEPFLYEEKTYADVIDKAHKLAPDVKIIEAVESVYLGKLDIYVPNLDHLHLWYSEYQKLREKGTELWFYTCNQPIGRYPNRYLDQPLLKVRVLHWLNYLYDIKGYLHWGLNQYADVDNFYSQQAISHKLPLGERAIVYPGKDSYLGSLRFSAQRDGIQDFEYLWVLENELKKIKERTGKDAFWLDPRQRPLELCRRVIWSFYEYTRDNNTMLQTRKVIAEEIEALKTQPLLIVQTTPEEAAIIPFGPRHLIIRGLTTPGAKVTINGEPVKSMEPTGYFFQRYFMAGGFFPDKGKALKDTNPTITITAEFNGKKRTVERTFKPID